MVIPRVMLQAWGKHQETKIWATHHWSGTWLIYTPGLLHLRRNGELGIHVLQEIGFTPIREEARGLFIHTGLDPHPPQFLPAPVCNHVRTESSIKHQARGEGMWQLRPRHSWGPYPRVTMTLVLWHPCQYNCTVRYCTVTYHLSYYAAY